MKAVLAVFFLCWVNVAAIAQTPPCIPKQTTVRLPGIEGRGWGGYMRVSPDGRFVLITVSPNRVLLFELTRQNGQIVARKYETPLKGEAYPTPDWEYIVSPYHDQQTQFFRVTDIINQQAKAKSKLNDSFTEFYNSVGGSKDNFRMVAWNFLASRRYHLSSSGPTKASGIEILCPNLVNLTPLQKETGEWWISRGGAMVSSITEIFDSVEGELKQSTEYRSRCEEDGESAVSNSNKKKFKAQSKYCADLFGNAVSEYIKVHAKRLRLSETDAKFIVQFTSDADANNDYERSQLILVNPIISHDGKEIAGFYNGRTRVFKINADLTCTETDVLPTRTSKISFSQQYENGRSRYLAFNDFYADPSKNSYAPGTFIYDRTTRQNINLRGDFGNYSTFTADGRLFNLSQGKDLVILDPYQVTNGQVYSSCIRENVSASIRGQPRNTDR